MIDSAIDIIHAANPWQLTLLLFILPVLLAAVLEFVMYKTLVHYIPNERVYLHLTLKKTRIPILTTITLIGAAILSNDPQIAATIYFTEDQINQFIGRPAISIIIIIWAFYINSLVNSIVEEMNSTTNNQVGKTADASPLLSNIISIGITIGTFAALLRLWNYDITPLLGAAGILGIALGFAARETVANFLGGIALYVDDTYTIGDFLELETGLSGSVVKIGIRSTTLLTKDNVQVNVPNSLLNNSKVINQSAPHKDIRIKIPIGVAYGTDIDKLEDILLTIAEEENQILENPTPSVRFLEFGDSAIQYELRGWIKSPLQINRVKHSVNTEIYKQLQEEGIEIPYPQQDINIKNED